MRKHKQAAEIHLPGGLWVPLENPKKAIWTHLSKLGIHTRKGKGRMRGSSAVFAGMYK